MKDHRNALRNWLIFNLVVLAVILLAGWTNDRILLLLLHLVVGFNILQFALYLTTTRIRYRRAQRGQGTFARGTLLAPMPLWAEHACNLAFALLLLLLNQPLLAGLFILNTVLLALYVGINYDRVERVGVNPAPEEA